MDPFDVFLRCLGIFLEVAISGLVYVIRSVCGGSEAAASTTNGSAPPAPVNVVNQAVAAVSTNDVNVKKVAPTVTTTAPTPHGSGTGSRVQISATGGDSTINASVVNSKDGSSVMVRATATGVSIETTSAPKENASNIGSRMAASLPKADTLTSSTEHQEKKKSGTRTGNAKTKKAKRSMSKAAAASEEKDSKAPSKKKRSKSKKKSSKRKGEGADQTGVSEPKPKTKAKSKSKDKKKKRVPYDMLTTESDEPAHIEVFRKQQKKKKLAARGDETGEPDEAEDEK